MHSLQNQKRGNVYDTGGTRKRRRLYGCFNKRLRIRKEVGELIYKGISWALKDLEAKMTPEEFNDYKLRVGAECAIAEPNSKLKVTKLHNLMFNTLKYLQYIEAQERNGEL